TVPAVCGAGAGEGAEGGGWHPDPLPHPRYRRRADGVAAVRSRGGGGYLGHGPGGGGRGRTPAQPVHTGGGARAGQPRATGLDLEAARRHSEYWEAVRGVYAPFETDLRAPSAEVYLHEIPGGQYSNLRPQAEAMGVGNRIPELKRMYAVVNELLGDI